MARTYTERELRNDGSLYSEKVTKGNIYEERHFDSYGNVIAQTRTVDGVKDGLEIKLNRDKSRSETTYLNGKKNGPMRVYAGNRLLMDANYKDDIPVGMQREWYPDGKPKSMGTFGLDGKQLGLSRKWNRDGEIEEESYIFDGGESVGRYSRYGKDYLKTTADSAETMFAFEGGRLKNVTEAKDGKVYTYELGNDRIRNVDAVDNNERLLFMVDFNPDGSVKESRNPKNVKIDYYSFEELQKMFDDARTRAEEVFANPG